MDGVYYVHEPTGFRIRVQRGEMGYFIASCTDLQGCHTQGSTLEEVLANIDDAIQTIREVMAEESLSPEYRTISITSVPEEGLIEGRPLVQGALPFMGDQIARLAEPGYVSDQTASPAPRLQWAA